MKKPVSIGIEKQLQILPQHNFPLQIHGFYVVYVRVHGSMPTGTDEIGKSIDLSAEF